ncbi:MAG: transcription-repair coupling factor [Bacteroidetes bacterium]|nr:transcription-repair coupling factor [Bacteroidota bacterium]HET6243475.1 transcription-repair coupling factor [Bacteroidia bacterium]
MGIEELIGIYYNDTRTQSIAEGIKTGRNHLHLTGITGSVSAFAISSVFKKSEKNHLVLLNSKEEAAYCLNDLENILGEQTVVFFPSSYRKAYQVESTDNANILLRAEVLNRINKAKKRFIIVTYPEALTEKVVTKKHLESNTFEISRASQLSLEFLNELFTEYHFERVDYVLEPGQFSIRGGIVDVFSFSNDNPYRIEFFGNEVETIRSFDTVDQLSIKNHERIVIIPNVQEKLLQESRTTFLEYLSEGLGQDKNTILWLKDYHLSKDLLQKQYELSEQAFTGLNSPLKHLPPSELFTSAESFASECLKCTTIEFGTRFYFPEALKIQYNCKPQPVFNKNFELLIENLHSNSKKNYKNIIFADTAKQTERIYTIFEDLKASKKVENDFNFTPILLSVQEGFIDNDLGLACYTDHQIFERYHRFRLKSSTYKKNEAITLKEIYGLNQGDFVTHIDHGVGRFAGLEKLEVNGKMQEAIRLVYKDNDILYVSIHSLHRIAKYSGKEGTEPKLNKLGSGAWATLKQKTKKKVKEIAFDLIKLYAKRRTKKGFAFTPDTYLQNELEASFIYEDTPDQIKSTMDVKRDMESTIPMDRLICGDVGFGKTEIAIRAAFKAVTDSKQVAILVPTTILALQHYKTFRERLKDFPCNIEYINRFRTAKQQKETLQKLEKGEIDILIGTHRIAGKDVKFKDLGLLIIDEEQKFGVAVKDKLKTMRETVDTLTLTATPIPRTLQFSLMGARDLSVINTPPPNRYPVQTELHTFNEETIRDAISFEISRDGQVFFVHNRIENLPEVAGMIQRLVPDARVLFAHGQMEGKELEERMLSFIEGEVDVLVSTTIIEAGLDITNANTIIINQAHMFGLSDLHQMRGRVGRSNKKAFCHLLCPPLSLLTPEARKRLTAIEQFSELGSGFNIAMRDLDIRGAGNLLGGEQSGFINEIGFEMYKKILDEAIQELKEQEFKELFEETRSDEFGKSKKKRYINDCQVDTDLEILIPDEYVTNITERLSLYKELDNIEKEEDLKKFEYNLIDRFGTVPESTLELMHVLRLRWIAMDIGFEKLVLKNNKLIGYFITKQDSPYYQSPAFTKVLQFVQENPRTCRMKQSIDKLSLAFENVSNVQEAIKTLSLLVVQTQQVV